MSLLYFGVRVPGVGAVGGAMLGVLEVATPVFLGAIGVEWFFGPKRFRINDSITSVTAGAMSMVLPVLWVAILRWPFDALRAALVQHGLVVQWDCWHWQSLLVLLVLNDLGYYAGHRGAHSINLFWAGHVVHHSSEEYNLSTALRQGSLEALFSIPFKLFLAFFCDYRVFRIHMDINMVVTNGPPWVFCAS